MTDIGREREMGKERGREREMGRERGGRGRERKSISKIKSIDSLLQGTIK